MALAAYATENSTPQLTQNELNIANKVVQVLLPVDEITNLFHQILLPFLSSHLYE